MANYAIGDIQGCYDPLMRLLDVIAFDDKHDRLWFVGDLVNRGPSSLEVLRFIQTLSLTPHIVLGNHDLHLIQRLIHDTAHIHPDDTLDAILQAPDREVICDFLRKQALLYHDETLNIVMCHAGIYPRWTLNEAKKRARQFEAMLQSDRIYTDLKACYGNQPNAWSDQLNEIEQLRVICNAFTRMRFCNAEGDLLLHDKGTLAQAPAGHYPWYAVPNRCIIQETIVFGHWAALKGECTAPGIYALDTGCVWGGPLTALRLEDKQRFSVPGA